MEWGEWNTANQVIMSRKTLKGGIAMCFRQARLTGAEFGWPIFQEIRSGDCCAGRLGGPKRMQCPKIGQENAPQERSPKHNG